MSSKRLQPRKRTVSDRRLTPNQRTFVAELLADENFNATAAAKRAGYKQPGNAASKLLAKRDIQIIVGRELKKRLDRIELRQEDVLEHLRTALFLDPLDLFEVGEDGSLAVQSLEDMPEKVRRCVTKLKVKVRRSRQQTSTTIELELMSKDAAMTNALKHLGLINPDNLNIVNAGPVDLRQLLEKVEEERSNVVDGEVIKRMAEDR